MADLTVFFSCLKKAFTFYDIWLLSLVFNNTKSNLLPQNMFYSSIVIKLVFFIENSRTHLVLFSSKSDTRVTLPEYGSRGKAFRCKGRPCRMLCYVDAYSDHTIKNSYIILTETGSIVVRNDCYFRHFTPFPNLLNFPI
jgi:hypothetical protein